MRRQAGQWVGGIMLMLMLLAGWHWKRALHRVVILKLAGGMGWQVEQGTSWRALDRGLEERSYVLRAGGSTVRITAFRCSAARVRLASRDFLFAAGWRDKARARVAVNGGYFDSSHKPLGLRVVRGRVQSPLRAGNWDIFYVKDGRAKIVSSRAWPLVGAVNEAVQCGPRLVTGGQTGRFKVQWARRTGIGIDRQGRVVVAIADSSLSLQMWAEQWRRAEGLSCVDALNLDGGGSTQMSVAVPGKHATTEGLWAVPDAVVVR